MNNLIGKVIRIDLDIYYVHVENTAKAIQAKIRGVQKKRGNVLVGDIVEVEKVDNDYMILKVRHRANFLIRPPVANIDQMIIVISLDEPSPDYILLDKQLILCSSKGIKPIICVNKIDLIDSNKKAKEEFDYIKKVYCSLYTDVIFLSAKEGIGIDKIKEKIKGKTSAFSGNSGVGKSSITRLLLKQDDSEIEVGDIGQKSKRGKHTTKTVRIYEICENTYILDTPGFSGYELFDIEYRNLKKFYPEYNDLRCVYEDCLHVTEGDNVCKVKKELENGTIDKGRYDRYVYIYTKLKEQYDRRYK